MAEQTFSSFESIEKGFKPFEFNKVRKTVLAHYFGKGGIIRAHLVNDKPKLVYPTKLRLRALIKEKEALRKNFIGKKRDWDKKFREAELYNLNHSVKKISSPLYWKHLAKTMSDADYKADAEKVKLPLHLVSDKRWQPMIRMFIENLEYRKQLTETVEHSIVYKKDKKLARYATELQQFRKSESSRKIIELQKKIDEANTDINSYNELIKWSNE